MMAKVRPNRQSGAWVGDRISDQLAFNLAKYDSIEDAVADLILWMDYVGFPKKPMSIKEQVSAMNQVGYFGNEPEADYLAKVLAWENR